MSQSEITTSIGKYYKFATPTFQKKQSSKRNSFECDFDDDMINQNIGVNPILSLGSPHQTSKQLFSQIEEPQENEQMEMINNLGLREIDNKENVQNIQQKQEEKPIINNVSQYKGKNQNNKYDGKENERKKLRVKKKKKQNDHIDQGRNLNQQNISDRIKTEIQMALTERTPITHNFQKNIEEYIFRKQQKIRELKIEQQLKTMKECTFTPKTKSKNASTTPRRNFEAFLESQEAFSTKVQLKRQQLKLKHQELSKSQESFRPVINKYNQGNKKKQPAYQRLYGLKDQRKNVQILNQNNEFIKPKSYGRNMKIQKSQINKPLCLFTERSNMNTNCSSSKARKTPVGELLYEDAMRRSNFTKTVAKNHLTSSSMFNSHLQSQNSSKSPIKMSKKTEKLVTQKLIKEYCLALQKLELLPYFLSDTSEQNKKEVDGFEFTHGEQNFYNKRQHKGTCDENMGIMDEINLANFQNILRQLGFMLYTQDDECELAYRQKSLAYEGYQFLQEYGVNIKNICIFLLGLIGVFSVDPLNFGKEDNLDSSDKKQLQLDDKQGRKIQKYFNLLYFNRLSSANKCKTDKIQQSSTQKNGTKSKHKEYTEYLANKHRQKMIEKTNQRFLSNQIDVVIPNNNVLTHQDMLVINEIGKNLSIQKMKKKHEQDSVDSQCTFHPKINKKNGKYENNQLAIYLQNCQDMRGKGMNKSKQLYEYAKTRKQLMDEKIRLQKSQEEELLESKQSKSLTHRSKKMKESFPKAKDVDKTIARMHEARKKRQQKEEFLKTGKHLNHNKNQHNMSQRSKNQNIRQHYESVVNESSNLEIINWRPATHRSPIKQNPRQPLKNEHSDLNDSKSRQIEPFLMIDVNMENQTKQMQFFSGDEHRLQQIVDDFCHKNDLDKQSKQQLLQLVVSQISNFLNNVGVDSTIE